jgi:hypothetical protein
MGRPSARKALGAPTSLCLAASLPLLCLRGSRLTQARELVRIRWPTMVHAARCTLHAAPRHLTPVMLYPSGHLSRRRGRGSSRRDAPSHPRTLALPNSLAASSARREPRHWAALWSSRMLTAIAGHTRAETSAQGSKRSKIHPLCMPVRNAGSQSVQSHASSALPLAPLLARLTPPRPAAFEKWHGCGCSLVLAALATLPVCLPLAVLSARRSAAPSSYRVVLCCVVSCRVVSCRVVHNAPPRSSICHHCPSRLQLPAPRSSQSRLAIHLVI